MRTFASALAFALSLTALAAPANADAGPAPDCTYTGGPGPDFPPVTDGKDVLCTGRGDDVIDPSPGNDVVLSGGGRDLVNGGPGEDVVYGAGGDDLLEGGSAGDRLYGGSGRDTIRGHGGFDRLWGDPGPDFLDGGDDPIADRLRGGPGNDKAMRHPNDVLDSAVFGYTFCKSEWYPCYTSANYTDAAFQVIDRDDCGGTYEPGSLASGASQQWNCGTNTGNFTYFEPVSGDQLSVYSYLPSSGIFKDPWVSCQAPNWQNLPAGTAPPQHACVPDYTGNGEWPTANVYLVDQDDPNYGLGMGQTCDLTAGGTAECPGFGEIEASNSGSVSILNNGPAEVQIRIFSGGSIEYPGFVNAGQTLTFDIDTGDQVGGVIYASSGSAQLLVTQVTSWGHDSVDAIADG